MAFEVRGFHHVMHNTMENSLSWMKKDATKINKKRLCSNHQITYVPLAMIVGWPARRTVADRYDQ